MRKPGHCRTCLEMAQQPAIFQVQVLFKRLWLGIEQGERCCDLTSSYSQRRKTGLDGTWTAYSGSRGKEWIPIGKLSSLHSLCRRPKSDSESPEPMQLSNWLNICHSEFLMRSSSSRSLGPSKLERMRQNEASKSPSITTHTGTAPCGNQVPAFRNSQPKWDRVVERRMQQILTKLWWGGGCRNYPRTPHSGFRNQKQSPRKHDT